MELPLANRFTKTWSHNRCRPVVRVFSDQICHPGYDTERGYVFTGFLILFYFFKKKQLLLVACAEVPISSIGTWKARHHRKRIRSRGNRDTPSSVIPLFTRKEYFPYVNVFTYWWTVDVFDDFLEPLAGPRAGRNGVST